MTNTKSAADIATAFTDARRRAAPIAVYPGELPATLTDAYAVQEAAIARWQDRITGWKVAGIAPDLREKFGAARLAGPAFASKVKRAGGDAVPSFAIFAGGFAAVEAEFIFRVGATIAPDDAASEDRLAAKIAAMHAGAEIASSPFGGINDLGPTSVISDFGNNSGLLLGPEIKDWRTRPLASLTSRALVNGANVGEGDASRVFGGPLAALAFLVAQLASRGRSLTSGDLVSTGMTTGIHPVKPGDRVRFEFVDDIVFEAVAEKAEPRA
ncbi:hypothetical protein [Terrarubrum flagellatum]|uniref:2-keto-4-pentenoate hydratase n=1 Tax=Terrirubrum flagellatum TaxID=2895980 RepID=UPI003145493E